MSTKKFHWGHGIALALLLFIGAMGYTVYLTFQNDYVLETESYYEKELNYDATRAAKKLGMDLDSRLQWTPEVNGDVVLTFDMIPDSVFCLLKHPQWEERDRTVRTHQEANVLRLHFGDEAPEAVSWRLELTAYFGGQKTLIEKRWVY